MLCPTGRGILCCLDLDKDEKTIPQKNIEDLLNSMSIFIEWQSEWMKMMANYARVIVDVHTVKNASSKCDLWFVDGFVDKKNHPRGILDVDSAAAIIKRWCSNKTARIKIYIEKARFHFCDHPGRSCQYVERTTSEGGRLPQRVSMSITLSIMQRLVHDARRRKTTPVLVILAWIRSTKTCTFVLQNNIASLTMH
jgi:hypothetical protein